MRMYGTLFNLTSNNIEIINLHVQLNNSIIGAAAALHSEVTEREIKPWNNGKEVPRWGVAEIQKMSPSTTGRCK